MSTKVGKITVIYSQMFGGKTSELVRRLEIFSRAGKCLLINHSIDTRCGDGQFSTHNTSINKDNVKFDVVKVDSLGLISDVVSRYKFVGIDEAQFFKKEDIDLIKKWVTESDVWFLVASLKGDFHGELFGHAHLLIPVSDELVQLTDTLCRFCSAAGETTKAIMSKRLVDDQDQQVLIGSEAYAPVCRSCYFSSGMKSARSDLCLSRPITLGLVLNDTNTNIFLPG